VRLFRRSWRQDSSPSKGSSRLRGRCGSQRCRTPTRGCGAAAPRGAVTPLQAVTPPLAAKPPPQLPLSASSRTVPKPPNRPQCPFCPRASRDRKPTLLIDARTARSVRYCYTVCAQTNDARALTFAHAARIVCGERLARAGSPVRGALVSRGTARDSSAPRVSGAQTHRA